jgi:hypothetical protein
MLKRILISGSTIILMLLLSACDTESEEFIPELLSVTPTNGAEEISKSTSIEVHFNEPMNIESCESRFGLYMGELSELPMNNGMMGGMMNGDNGFVHGGFHWNNDSTTMTFQPENMLMDSTMYSICLWEGMQTHRHGEEMMPTGMNGYGMEVGNGVISHFLTK